MAPGTVQDRKRDSRIQKPLAKSRKNLVGAKGAKKTTTNTCAGRQPRKKKGEPPHPRRRQNLNGRRKCQSSSDRLKNDRGQRRLKRSGTWGGAPNGRGVVHGGKGGGRKSKTTKKSGHTNWGLLGAGKKLQPSGAARKECWGTTHDRRDKVENTKQNQQRASEGTQKNWGGGENNGRKKEKEKSRRTSNRERPKGLYPA